MTKKFLRNLRKGFSLSILLVVALVVSLAIVVYLISQRTGFFNRAAPAKVSLEQKLAGLPARKLFDESAPSVDKPTFFKSPQTSQESTSQTSFTATIDARQFININGQKTFLIFDGGLSGTQHNESIGGNVMGIGINRIENGVNLDERFSVANGTVPLFVSAYGEGMMSFTCNKSSQYDQSDGVNGPADRCVPCTKLNNLCPWRELDANGNVVKLSCNYCNPDFYNDNKTPAEADGQRDLIEEIKGYPNYIGYYFDEPSKIEPDPRLYEIPKQVKAADPNKLIAAVDNMSCLVEKEVGKDGRPIWKAQTQNAGKLIPYHCSDFWEKTTKAALDFFASPYVDIIGAESGYWAKFKPGHFASTQYFPPKKDDIQQLIGGIEYFRQEVKKRTGQKKPVLALMQLQDLSLGDPENLIAGRPSYDEIRSMIYTSLGHQARGIMYYNGNYNGSQSNDPNLIRVNQDLKTIISELNTEGVLTDYLDPTMRGHNRHISTDKKNVDATAFYTQNPKGKSANYYIIVTSLQENNTLNNVTVKIEPLRKAVTAELIGSNNTKNFNKGQSSFKVTLKPHETKVYRLSFTKAEIESFTLNADDYE